MNPLVLADGVHQRAALGHGEGQRLLGIYVESGLQGVDGGEYTGVCGGFNEYRVQLLFVEHGSVIAILVPLVAFRHPLGRHVQSRGEANAVIGAENPRRDYQPEKIELRMFL